MVFGRKSSIDVIDFTDLQKRGLLKSVKVEQESPELVDFTKTIEKNEQEGLPNPVTSNNAITPSLFNFDNVSTSSVNNESNNSFLGFMDNPSNNLPSNSPVNDDSNINGLKLKIEDLEYKLERLLERLDKIENLGVR